MNIRRNTKLCLGFALSKVYPEKTKILYNNFTVPFYSQHPNLVGNFVERLIRFYLGERESSRVKKRPDHLESLHRAYWKKHNGWHIYTAGKKIKFYITAYGDTIKRLSPILAEKKIQTVCEFGTGDAEWLDYLSKTWSSVPSFIGIDISEPQIGVNKKRYVKMSFYQSDIIEWVDEHATSRTLYHANGGVLEYLAEESLAHMFRAIKQRSPESLILLFEPQYGSFDRNLDMHSVINSGLENSYSHNYFKLISDAGMHIMDYKEQVVLGQRFAIISAST